MYHHDEFLVWQTYFVDIKVNLYIVTADEESNNKLIKELYHSQLNYISVTDIEEYKKWEVLKIKNVFGKSYETIYPYMYMMYNREIVKVYKRINHQTIKNMFFDALEIQYKNFVKKIKKSIDINSKL